MAGKCDNRAANPLDLAGRVGHMREVMTELRTICVYCGSNAGRAQDYTEAAITLGREIAAAGAGLVYGGGSIGLMGIVARSAMEAGAPVTGVIPGFLRDREVMLKEVTELIVTDDMHDRKQAMFDRADAFVTLPGGIGTLEEVIEVATWAQLDQHAKPIVMVNTAGFWNPLKDQFRRMAHDGFLAKEFLGEHVALPLEFVDRAEDAVPRVRELLAAVAPEDLEKPDGVELM